jgi:hypothetical protein
VSVSGMSSEMLSHPLQLKSEYHSTGFKISSQIRFSSLFPQSWPMFHNSVRIKILGQKLKFKLKCTVKKFNFITCFFGPSQMCQGEDAAAFRLDYF